VKRKAWRLDPAEVHQGGSAQATSASRKGTKCGDSWTKQVRTFIIILTHVPTDVRVEGKIGPAQLSKAKWGVERDKLHDRLMKELEVKVARHMRISGW
jgi:hypothetical protein